MQITGITQSQFRSIVDTLNAYKYADNHIVIENIRDLSNSGKRITVKLGMTDSRGPGSRRSASGRHGKYCSYYTFWDVMAGAFHYGATRIKGGDTVYSNPLSFDYEAYEGESRNVGSMMHPVFMGDLSVDPDFDNERFDWNNAV